MDEWINISVLLPEVGKNVLLLNHKNRVIEIGHLRFSRPPGKDQGGYYWALRAYHVSAKLEKYQYWTNLPDIPEDLG